MLTIIRGIPGSGKTTYAKYLMQQLDGPMPYHFEADDYFNIGGSYHWSPKYTGEAHKWCQFRVRTMLEHGHNVIVSNTFVLATTLHPYIDMCDELNIPYRIFRMYTEYKNTHNVPEEVVQRMKDTMEDVEGEIPVAKRH